MNNLEIPLAVDLSATKIENNCLLTDLRARRSFNEKSQLQKRKRNTQRAVKAASKQSGIR